MPAGVLVDIKSRVVTHSFMMSIVKIEACLLAPILPEATNERTIIPINGNKQTLTYWPALPGFDKEADFLGTLPGQPYEASDFKISYPLPKGPLAPPPSNQKSCAKPPLGPDQQTSPSRTLDPGGGEGRPQQEHRYFAKKILLNFTL